MKTQNQADSDAERDRHREHEPRRAERVEAETLVGARGDPVGLADLADPFEATLLLDRLGSLGACHEVARVVARSVRAGPPSLGARTSVPRRAQPWAGAPTRAATACRYRRPAR